MYWIYDVVGPRRMNIFSLGVEYVIVSQDRNIQRIKSSKHYDIKDGKQEITSRYFDKPSTISSFLYIHDFAVKCLIMYSFIISSCMTYMKFQQKILKWFLKMRRYYKVYVTIVSLTGWKDWCYNFKRRINHHTPYFLF